MVDTPKIHPALLLYGAMIDAERFAESHAEQFDEETRAQSDASLAKLNSAVFAVSDLLFAIDGAVADVSAICETATPR